MEIKFLTNNFKLDWCRSDSVVSLAPLSRATNTNIGWFPGRAQRPRYDSVGGPIKAS